MSSSPSWDDQKIFLAILEEGSLAGAARRLGLSHPTVRSRLEGLEATLAAPLFIRSVGGMKPTELANALFEPARAMAMASELFTRIAASSPHEMAGVVRLSVSEFIGVDVLPAVLARLRQTHPAIRIELSLSNAPADLLAQEVDIAIRNFAPQQAALVARRVAAVPLGFFASADYLARRGMPASLDELAGHDLVGPDRRRSDLQIVERLGPAFTRSRFVLCTDSHPAQLAAARAGIGIAVVQVPVALADPGLRRVLPDHVVATLDTWIVTHETLRNTPRVRAVFDSLVSAFQR